MLIDVTNESYFGDLVGGDTFYYRHSNCIWMKLNAGFKVEGEDTKFTAVSLDDGTLAEFYDSEQVVVIKTKLVNA